MRRSFALAAVLFAASPALAAPPDAATYFEKKVRPLLAERCWSCHGAERQKGGLRLDSRAALLEGGVNGAALVPGKPDESLLLAAVRHRGKVKMPPRDKLPDADVVALTEWVAAGAVWPGPASAPPRTFTAEERAHWAFQPVKITAPPTVKDAAWARTPLDRFVLARLEAAGLRPAPEADRLTLLRRVTLDLTGLPPTPDEVAAFLADASPDAWDKLIDRLLASPAYGEKWGRRWLDVARYADSNGMDENLAHANAWRYRDYVIRSFNADKPYDRFVKEQIAGDLLPGGTDAERAERLIATGFLVVGPKMLAEDDPVKMRMDVIDEQLDTLGQAFLGLTLGCARCHDHKFDPITAADYYGLAGIFYSTKTMQSYSVVARWHERLIGSEASVAALAEHEKKRTAAREALTQAEKRLREAIASRLDRERGRTVGYAAAAMEVLRRGEKTALAEIAADHGLLVSVLRRWVEVSGKPAADDPFRPTPDAEAEVDPAATAEVKQLRERLAAVEKGRPPVDEAMAVEDGKGQNLHIHLRGNHLTLGAEAPRRLPVVLAGERQPALGADRSGRLELAEWVASKDNPLTARVMANRIWLGHFGGGLVRTPDNFGRLGERPTHPELLDYLADEFVRSGWSVKHLHRLILRSAAYRMSTRHDPAAFRADPDNRLLWRFNRRRLDAEEQRDGMLAVAGLLDRTAGGSLLSVANRQYVTSTANRNYEAYATNRRSVYLPVIRSAVYDVLQTNDFPDPSTPAGLRPTTTVPTQALLLLNSTFADRVSEAVAKSLLAEPGDDTARLRLAYRRAYGRAPTDAEAERVLTYLARSETADGAPEARRMRAWRGLCRVLFASGEFAFVE